MTLGGLPSAKLGYTSRDVFALQWVERWTYADGVPTAVFVFETVAADAPPDGKWDVSSYGMWAADDGSLVLAAPITSGATSLNIAPTNNTSPVMTTASGDYSLVIDLAGEYITLAAAPGTATRTNLITNPSIETNTTGWGAAGTQVPTLTRSTDFSLYATQSLKIVWGNGAANTSRVQWTATVTNGQTYTFSVWVRPTATGPKMILKDRSASALTGVTFTPTDSGTTGDGWVRLSMTGTATSTTAIFSVENATTTSGSPTSYLDGALLENASTLGSYFDGANGGAWTGTANASTSTQSVQTYTGATRGVSPSIARAHLAGESVEIHYSAYWAMG